MVRSYFIRKGEKKFSDDSLAMTRILDSYGEDLAGNKEVQ